MDLRWKQLADLLVTYSTGVKPGERVMIAFGELDTYPLMHSVYQACIQAGAFPQVQFLSEDLNRQMLCYGSAEQIAWVPEVEAFGMEWADVYLGLRGAHNLNTLWDIPADRLAQFRKAMGQISTLRWGKTRWCILRVPNPSLAQQACVDEATLTDMFFRACLLDWPVISQGWKRWAERVKHRESGSGGGKRHRSLFFHCRPQVGCGRWTHQYARWGSRDRPRREHRQWYYIV